MNNPKVLLKGVIITPYLINHSHVCAITTHSLSRYLQSSLSRLQRFIENILLIFLSDAIFAFKVAASCSEISFHLHCDFVNSEDSKMRLLKL